MGTPDTSISYNEFRTEKLMVSNGSRQFHVLFQGLWFCASVQSL